MRLISNPPKNFLNYREWMELAVVIESEDLPACLIRFFTNGYRYNAQMYEGKTVTRIEYIRFQLQILRQCIQELGGLGTPILDILSPTIGAAETV
jgi:hypothetical protein